ncbi:hypothetical protein PV433_26910 [Paenibacillus sp. GYB004]|uniref:hypothetical protein n=1 Tax=Paenibacillus sp. GYB004 TaxID=2994393 RepID=UPI002F96BF01
MKALKMVKKTVVVGGLAAAMMFGSAVSGFGGSAFAAEVKSQVNYQQVVDQNLSFVIGHVASIADREDYSIRDALSQGQSLVQASGLTSQELLNRLVESMNQSIDFAARNDKDIEKDDLNRIKSEAAGKLSTIINTNGYDDTKYSKVDYDKIVKRELSSVVILVSAYADKQDSVIRDALQEGKTLVEASGLKHGELLDKLKASISQSIDFAAKNDKTTTKEELNEIKSKAASELSKIISTNGYDDSTYDAVETDYTKLAEKELSYTVIRVSAYADKKDSEIRDALRQGKTLVEASGLKHGELLDKLTASLNQSIDFAAKNDKSVEAEEISRIKSEAAGKLSKIITTNGYDDRAAAAKVDYKKLVEKELSYTAIRVSAQADKDYSTIVDALQNGKTLVEASGLKHEDLLKQLIESLNQSIDFAAKNDKTVTAEELNRIKSEAAGKLSTILSSSGGYKG